MIARYKKSALKIIVLASFFMPQLSTLCKAQNVLYETATVWTDTAIIRCYQPGIDIVYNDRGKKNRRGFNYVNKITGNINTIHLFQSYGEMPDFSVFDFRIYDDTIYFCGQNEGKALFGRIPIAEFFNLPTYVDCWYLDDLLLPPANITLIDRFNSLKKIKIFEAAGGKHIVMVGTGCYEDNDPGSSSMIVDVIMPNGSSPILYYVMDYEMRYHFDDIAVTDNYVVVAACDEVTNSEASGRHVLFPYIRPLNVSSNIFSPYIVAPPFTMSTSVYSTPPSVFNVESVDDIRIAGIASDTIVTVCNALIEEGSWRTVVNVYESPVLPPIERVNFAPTCYNRYKEIAYSKKYSKICMVPNLIDEIYYWRFSSPYVSHLKTSSDMLWQSIDEEPIKKSSVVLSGINRHSNIVSLWDFDDVTGDNCTVYDRIDTNNMYRKQTEDTVIQYWNRFSPRREQMYIYVKLDFVNVKCD